MEEERRTNATELRTGECPVMFNFFFYSSSASDPGGVLGREIWEIIFFFSQAKFPHIGFILGLEVISPQFSLSISSVSLSTDKETKASGFPGVRSNRPFSGEEEEPTLR